MLEIQYCGYGDLHMYEYVVIYNRISLAIWELISVEKTMDSIPEYVSIDIR